MRRVLLVISSGLLVGGCASRIRTELVGTGHGLVSTRGAAGATDASAAPGGAGIPLPRGTYDFDLRLGVSRAQRIDWKVSCGADEQTGTVGETFEDYRARRIAQLEQERERQARYLAAATRQAPAVEATVVARPPTTTVRTPVGRVIVQPAPVVVHTQTVEPPPPVIDHAAPPIDLPPGDLGQGVFPARVRVVTRTDGVCLVSAVADDPDVSAFFSVTRVRDLGLEEAERKQIVLVGAVGVRGRMTERLIGYGADPQARQRRLEEEQRAHAEAEVRRLAELERRRVEQAQLDAERARKQAEDDERIRIRRLENERRIRAEREARDRDHRAKLEREERERRLRLEAEAEVERLRLEAEAKARWEADAPRRAALQLELEQRQVSVQWRLTLIAWLVRECHADPDRRGRIAREEERVRRERQAKLELRLELERIERERVLRIRLEAERVERERLQAERERRMAADRAERLRREAELENQRAIDRARREREARELAELELRRTHEALRVRQSMMGHLVAFGARIRPPRPEDRLERPGAPPFDGAVWANGRWEWVSLRAEWVWHGGGWRDSGRSFGEAGDVDNGVRPAVVVESAPRPITTTTTTVTVEAPPPVVIKPPSPGVVIEVGGTVRPPRGSRPAPRGRGYRPAPRADRPAQNRREGRDGYRPAPRVERRKDRRD